MEISEAMLPFAQSTDGRRPLVMADDLHLRIEDLRIAAQFQDDTLETAHRIEDHHDKAFRHFG
jgi:hypothetical protein